jgi:uncharacterized protein
VLKPSAFNVRVPLANGEVFLMNTLTEAQAVVSEDVVAVLDRLDSDTAGDRAVAQGEREALATLADNGFVVRHLASERAALEAHFAAFREDTSQLRVTILTTLQCNFACDYCYQGEHADLGRQADRMSIDTATRVAAWIAKKVEEVQPRQLVLTFFGGEPLLNVPAMFEIAGRSSKHAASRGVTQLVNIITNGLLLTPQLVEGMVPLGLTGVKVTLDGDRETHDRMRPLRGGQGTFDRIVENIRRVAGRCRIAIGGNLVADAKDRYVELLDYLAAQEFAPLLDKVTFKPVIAPRPDSSSPTPRVVPLTLAGAPAPSRAVTGRAQAPASAACGPCDGCHFADEAMSDLREATRARGFRTEDGLHMGPCELHRRHAYTIGPDGSLYACPGFTGEASLAVGHVEGDLAHADDLRSRHYAGPSPWRTACGDCAFVPVCGGGCSVAAHAAQGDPLAPACHKPSFDAAVRTIAADWATHNSQGEQP